MHRRRSWRSCQQVRGHAARSAASSQVRPATSSGCAFASAFRSQCIARTAPGRRFAPPKRVVSSARR
jgi:hypothetical protein